MGIAVNIRFLKAEDIIHSALLEPCFAILFPPLIFSVVLRQSLPYTVALDGLKLMTRVLGLHMCITPCCLIHFCFLSCQLLFVVEDDLDFLPFS